MSHTPGTHLNGAPCALLARQGGLFSIPAGDLFEIPADQWRTPCPLKLHRFHLAINATGAGVVVEGIWVDGKQVVFGPVPSQAFATAMDTDFLVGFDPRWNPFLGHEITERSQIRVLLANRGGVLATAVVAWFTTGICTGRPHPTSPNGV